MTELQFDKEDRIIRNCLRCGVEMVEDLTVSGEVDPAGLRVSRGGVFKDPLGRLKAAVCPCFMALGQIPESPAMSPAA